MTNSLEKIYADVSFGLNVQIIGITNTKIGAGSCIGDNTWINVCYRDEQTVSALENDSYRQKFHDSAGGNITIGDFCLFAPNVYVSEADHKYQNITRPYSEQGATAGNLVIEDNCWLGINTAITGNFTVGRGSVIGATVS